MLTLVGVLGQVALMSFLLGRWPRCRVTLEGAPEADVGADFPFTPLVPNVDI